MSLPFSSRVLISRHRSANACVENEVLELVSNRETPAAPVFVDGEKKVTLRGDNIAQEFVALIDDYVEHKYVRSAG